MNDAQIYGSGWIVIGAAATVTCAIFGEWGIAAFAGVVTVASVLFLLWDVRRTRNAR